MGQMVINFLNRSVFFIFLLVISIIMGLNLFFSRGYHSAERETPEMFNGITLIGSLILIAIILVFRQKIINFTRIIPKVYLVVTLLVISVLLQLIAVRMLSVNPSWDFGAIVSNSKLLLETGELNEYFVRYPNNILLVCMLAFIGKVFTPELLTYQIFNIMMITFSQYLIYRIASKIAGQSIGIVSLFGSVLFFPYIFFAPIVYTDTVSLIFLLLPLNMLIDQNGNFRNHLLILIIVSIMFSLGMVLKGSLIIFLIAFSIVLFLFSKKWKKVYFIIPFLILLIVKTIFNFYIYEYGMIDKQQVEKYSFPVTHWLVMGQNERKFGKYSEEDVGWTAQLLNTTSREEASHIHLKELKMRIKEKGWVGNLQYNREKLTHTWTDGTYYSLNKLKRTPVKPENYTHLVDYKSGHLIQGYARIQHIMILVGLFFIVRIKDKNEFLTFAMLSVIGFFFFFILWEARSRYLVSLTPLLILLSCIGYFGINKKQLSEKS